MDGAALSRFPHHSWLRFRLKGSNGPRAALSMEGVSHTVCCTFQGRQDVRQITRGHERSWHEDIGSVNILPADGELHTFVTTMSPDLNTVVLLIPRRHLQASLTAEGCPSSATLRRGLFHDDPVLRACIARVAADARGDDHETALRADEASRQLLLRMMQLQGGPMPDWYDDAGVFDGRTLDRLVEYIDAHLRNAPSLADMATHVALSPSHFARKFRQSTGLSLCRFVNRRRVHRSLNALTAGSDTLAGIALDLGFSSQSHFTRLFSLLTGMTPAKYQKSVRRTIG